MLSSDSRILGSDKKHELNYLPLIYFLFLSKIDKYNN